MQQDVRPIHEEEAHEGFPPAHKGLIHGGAKQAQAKHHKDKRHEEDRQEASEQEHRHLRTIIPSESCIICILQD